MAAIAYIADPSTMTLDDQLAQTFRTASDRFRDDFARLTATLRASVDAEGERLLEGFRSMGSAHSLSGILEVLIESASREAARTAILLVQGGAHQVWRDRGFEAGEAAAAFASVSSNDRAVAMPIVLGGHAVAVLYADQGPNASEDAGEEGAPNSGTLNRRTLEVLAHYAARCLESLTASKATRALMARSEAAGVPPAPLASVPSSDVPAPAERRSADDEDGAARRYARLLVSEIKLYHEGEVVAGRAAGDLGIRLRDEIARARALYAERVPADVDVRGDYFHAELVRTLANGDERLLEAGD